MCADSLNVPSRGAESLVEQICICSNTKQQESLVEQICNIKPRRIGFGARRGTNFCLMPIVHQMLPSQQSCGVSASRSLFHR